MSESVEPAESVETAEATPILRVVNADATPEEIAAIVAVFSALGGGEEAPAPRRTPEWRAPHRKTRVTPPHGPGGWRSSTLPR